MKPPMTKLPWAAFWNALLAPGADNVTKLPIRSKIVSRDIPIITLPEEK